MTRNHVAASFSLIAGLAAALAAQTLPPNGKADQKSIQSIRIRVTGCVAGGGEVGHYRLTNAALSGDDVPSKAGAAGKVGSGKDVSFENSPTFELIGGRLQAYVGHKVEVIGITSDTKLNDSESFSAAIGSSAHEKATLTVSAVKMIAAKCP
jgi:hypothetical protein